MNRYACVPHHGNSDTATDGSRFHVRAASDADAIEDASKEACRTGFPCIHVEDSDGRQVYDGHAAP